MNCQIEKNNDIARIQPTGALDSQNCDAFRSLYLRLLADRKLREIEVDLAGIDVLDSLGLGMLLVLREKASLEGKDFILTNLSNVARHALDTINYGKIFSIR